MVRIYFVFNMISNKDSVLKVVDPRELWLLTVYQKILVGGYCFLRQVARRHPSQMCQCCPPTCNLVAWTGGTRLNRSLDGRAWVKYNRYLKC